MDSESSLEETVVRILSTRRRAPVSEICDLLERDLGREEVVHAIERLKADGRIRLEPAVDSSCTLFAYLLNPDYSLWYQIFVISVFLTSLSAYLVPSVYPISFERWVSGTLVVVFFPGYAATQMLFPSANEINAIEKVVFSIALSLVISPLVGLLIDELGFVISLAPVVMSLAFVSLVMASIGEVRKMRSAQSHITGASHGATAQS